MANTHETAVAHNNKNYTLTAKDPKLQIFDQFSVPEVSQIDPQSVPNQSPKCPKSVPKVSQIGPQSVPNQSPKYLKSVPKLSQIDSQKCATVTQKNAQKLSLAFVNDFCE